MMKWLGILLGVIGFLVLSCHPDQNVLPLTATRVQESWTTIEFNSDYTIQFPPDRYRGKGYSFRTPARIGDSPTLISRNDEQVTLTATFCDPNAYPCLLVQYGQELPSPAPRSVVYLNSKGEPSALNQTIGFTKEGHLLGILYYANDPTVLSRSYTGHLYLLSKASGSYHQAGVALFSDSTQQEVFELLSTLTRK